MDTTKILDTLVNLGTEFGVKVLGAIALWIVGNWLIRIAINLMRRALDRQKVAQTIVTYVASALSVTLKILLVVGILGFFGIQTTTFAALLAGLGLAIGTAWSGLLGNFASGAFLVILHPFKVGDFITAGGVTGTVEEIGLFVTTVNTPDNVRTFIGNNKIFSDTIQNFSSNPFRRVELIAQLDHTTDHKEAISMLKDRLAQIPNVVPTPGPEVEILTFNPMGPVLAVRPFCHNDHYWQVYFDTNRIIRESFGDAGYAVPKQHYAIKQS
jgi:small conductance mechanosensitive channel